jgi:hypothetical protein
MAAWAGWISKGIRCAAAASCEVIEVGYSRLRWRRDGFLIRTAKRGVKQAWGAAQAAPFSIYAQIKRNFSAQACNVTSAWLIRAGAANGKY